MANERARTLRRAVPWLIAAIAVVRPAHAADEGRPGADDAAVPARVTKTVSVAPPVADAAAPTERPGPGGGKRYDAKQVTANLLAEAARLQREGRAEDAKLPLRTLLAARPQDVRTREMLVQLELDTGHVEPARSLLAEGRRLLPSELVFTLSLARLQAEAGDVDGAMGVLQSADPALRDEAQWHALCGALLLRQRRHGEALPHYLAALWSAPDNAPWLLGAGAALEGLGRPRDALEAYRRAQTSSGLTPEQMAFVDARLAALVR